jgi:radical SAM superfamily enzyme YgiQ (UPF0313 family)
MIVLAQTRDNYGGNKFEQIAKNKMAIPPLGLLYLGTILRRAGYDVTCIDGHTVNRTTEEMVDDILGLDPDYVGISTATHNFPFGKEIATLLKTKRPKLPIIIGGVHVTSTQAERFAEEEMFDFALIGEGERAIVKFTELFYGCRDWSQVPGLVWRDDGQVVRNSPVIPIANLDELPIVDMSLFRTEEFSLRLPSGEVTGVAPIASSRGCPYKCSFCAEPNLFGRKLRKRSATHVVDEMEALHNTYGISHFFFYDSTLTLDRKHLIRISELILQRGLKVTWEGWSRADRVDEELLTKMRDAGFVRMSVGIESGDPQVLSIIRKGMTPQDNRNALDLAVRLGIEVEGFAMLGHPGDTLRSILKTAWFLRRLPHLAYSSFSIAIPYPGTELYHFARTGMHGLRLLNEDYTQYSRYEGGVMEVNGMSPKQLQLLQKLGLIIIHSSPQKILACIKRFGVANVLRFAWQILLGTIGAFFGRQPPMKSSAEQAMHCPSY